MGKRRPFYLGAQVGAQAAVTGFPLGFDAKCIIIDNPGGQWIYLPDLQQTIQPNTTGVVLPLSRPLQLANATSVSQNAQQIATGLGAFATVTWSEDALPGSSGVMGGGGAPRTTFQQIVISGISGTQSAIIPAGLYVATYISYLWAVGVSPAAFSVTFTPTGGVVAGPFQAVSGVGNYAFQTAVANTAPFTSTGVAGQTLRWLSTGSASDTLSATISIAPYTGG